VKLARTIRLDTSDTNVFSQPAEMDEWAVSGAFEFSNWTEADLTGKERQAFANGWLGVETFGRATFVAVIDATEAEVEAVAQALAAHFVAHYGAPDVAAALPVAREEVGFMASLCDEHETNTLLAVERTLTDTGVKEAFRAIKPKGVSIEAFAVHAD